MLQLQYFSSPSEKSEFLQTFDPHRSSWIVSDLKSKLAIQQKLLQSTPVIEDDSVLRANELWKSSVLQYSPSSRIVSKDLILTLLEDWLQQSSFDWAKTPGAPRTLADYIQQLLPVLSQQQSLELLDEWFAENTNSYLRWKHWLELSKWAWNQLCDEELVTSDWLAGFVIAKSLPTDSWSRELVVDLGSQFSAVEAELFFEISKHQSVRVLVPSPLWSQEYDKTLWGYDVLHELAGQLQEEQNSSQSRLDLDLNPRIYRKFSTQLSEVKDATAQVRSWLDEGVPPNKVAVVASDIEEYWPTLSSYLREEGIPVDKPSMVKLHSLPSVMSWLARLRLEAGEVGSSDLELSHFCHGARQSKMSFDKFKQLFHVMYDASDLKRDGRIEKYYAPKLSRSTPVDRDEFIGWVLTHWTASGEEERLQSVLLKVLEEAPEQLNMQIGRWLRFLESICARIEIKTEGEGPSGLHCTNILFAEWLDISHLYVLGMTDETLRTSQSSGLNLSDILSLRQQLGFNLESPDKAQLEFELKWLLESPMEAVVMASPATSFRGDAKAPSLMWLTEVVNRGGDIEALSPPGTTRWDEVQSLSLEKICETRFGQSTSPYSSELKLSLLQDQGEAKLEVLAEGRDQWKLSVSQIENFLKCPFILAAKKLFHLSDLPDLDLDLDRMTRGKFIHKLFEKLTEEPFRSTWTTEELFALVEECREREEVLLGDENLWPPLRQQYVELAQRFLKQESDWRKRFPELQTVGREQYFEVGWDSENQMFSENLEGSVSFRGYIDRIDKDEKGRYAVIDYKSSAGNTRNISSWHKNHELQLAVYSQVVEAGLAGMEPGEVLGAFYYIAKTLNRSKGFVLEHENETLFPVDKRARNRVNSSQKKEHFQQLNQEIHRSVEAIKKGALSPDPEDQRVCQSCDWKSLCRAPHLN